MKDYCFIFILASIHIAQCVIPSLIVKKLDKTLIARKRQDTMDMCRIFTEESRKAQHNHVPKIIKSYRPEKDKIRHKRDASEETPRENHRYKRDGNEESHRYKRDDNEEVQRYKRDGNEENNRYKRDGNEENQRDKRDGNEENNRYKRGATMKYAVNPALNPEDARRVENIVDRLYDDMEEKGQRVTYRQARTTSSAKSHRNKTFRPSRRFDFAPALLTGPQAQLKEKIEPDEGPFYSKARWKHGIVPYFIDFKTYDAHLTEVIMKAFDYVEKATCIRLQKLREKPTDKQSLETVPWLYISNPTGIRQCVHSNEKRRVNGVLMTVFGYDCMSLGDIVHEVMHILGYSHEHLRSDRDEHISILWNNIKPGYKKYFDLNVFGSEYALESLPYDYSSILHYPPRAFSKNGKVTIVTEQGIKIGQREGLSEIDVEKVALIYSNECVSRNREYLLQTCPSVVKSVMKPVNITQKEIDDYFKERLWSFGIINFKFRDQMEFTIEERENIKAVFRHIEQETCLQFRDVGTNTDDADEDDDDEHLDQKDIILEKEAKAEENLLAQTVITEQPDDTTELPTEPAVPEVENPESEVDKPEAETVKPEAELDTNANAENVDSDVPVITVGPVALAQESDENDIDHYDIAEKKKTTEIIITNPNNSLRQGLKEPVLVIGNKKELKENEKQKNVEKALNSDIGFKSMNLTMKKSLLKRATAKRKQNSRVRRDTSGSPRRHANAILVLKRSPDPACPCPAAGAPKGDQVLDIGAGCFNSVNDLLHFFVHVLGLDHQHNMHDRDNYLHVVWENLTADVASEMQNKLPPAASVGFSYDYQSVMHYPWLQIKSGKTNIMYPIWNDGWAMGHWQGLSSVDVQKLNLLYFSQCLERQKQEKQ